MQPRRSSQELIRSSARSCTGTSRQRPGRERGAFGPGPVPHPELGPVQLEFHRQQCDDQDVRVGSPAGGLACASSRSRRGTPSCPVCAVPDKLTTFPSGKETRQARLAKFSSGRALAPPGPKPRTLAPRRFFGWRLSSIDSGSMAKRFCVARASTSHCKLEPDTPAMPVFCVRVCGLSIAVRYEIGRRPLGCAEEAGAHEDLRRGMLWERGTRCRVVQFAVSTFCCRWSL